MSEHRDSAGSADFRAEAEELLENLGLELQEAERECRQGPVSIQRINTLFRGIHSLKGLSGMFGRGHLSDLSHSLEDFLELYYRATSDSARIYVARRTFDMPE